MTKIATALELEPKVFFEFDALFHQPASDRKDSAIQDVLAILKAKEVRHIHMTKKLLVEIFKTFPRQ